VSIFALTASARVALILVVAFVVVVAAAAMVASYGYGRGFRFWPLFLSALFLGFPLVLLAIAIAVGLVDEYRLVNERRDETTDAAESQRADVDIPDQIRKLGELRETGILTEEEFDATKAELLQRL
jgi:hypothetical protein